MGANAKIFIKIIIKTSCAQTHLSSKISSKIAPTLISPDACLNRLDFLKINPVPFQTELNSSISIFSALGLEALGSIMVTVFF